MDHSPEAKKRTNTYKRLGQALNRKMAEKKAHIHDHEAEAASPVRFKSEKKSMKMDGSPSKHGNSRESFSDQDSPTKSPNTVKGL